MAVGFGLLGLEPRAFWSMTLAELDAAVRGRFGLTRPEHPPSRLEFEELARRYPDIRFGSVTRRHGDERA